MKGEKGSADIKLSEGVVLLKGFIIPIVQIGHSDSLRKVVSAENVIIPPKSEIIVDVHYIFGTPLSST
jgi:ADP-glucose pyrophosphorylase